MEKAISVKGDFGDKSWGLLDGGLDNTVGNGDGLDTFLDLEECCGTGGNDDYFRPACKLQVPPNGFYKS